MTVTVNGYALNKFVDGCYVILDLVESTLEVHPEIEHLLEEYELWLPGTIHTVMLDYIEARLTFFDGYFGFIAQKLNHALKLAMVQSSRTPTVNEINDGALVEYQHLRTVWSDLHVQWTAFISFSGGTAASAEQEILAREVSMKREV